jgi:hypothetical protein
MPLEIGMETYSRSDVAGLRNRRSSANRSSIVSTRLGRGRALYRQPAVLSTWPGELANYCSSFIYLFFSCGVHLVLRPLFGLLYQPRMIHDDDVGAIGGMKIGRGNRSTRRKPAPVPLGQPQIPHDRTQARTRAAEVGRRRLTAWAVARPTTTTTTTTTTNNNNNTHNLYFSSYVITSTIFKSSRMKWAGHVAHIGGRRKQIGCLLIISVYNATIYFLILTLKKTCFGHRWPSSGVPLCQTCYTAFSII